MSSNENLDDSVDDLDDVLEDFVQPSARSPSPAPAVHGPSRPSAPAEDEEALDEQFFRDMQKQMEAMLSGLDVRGHESDLAASNGIGNDSAAPTTEEDKALQALFEKLLSQEPEIEADAKGKGSAAGVEADFQETIRKTMAKMRESGEGVKADLEAQDDDPMSSLLKTLTGGQSEEDLRGALEGMMEQLLSKELLEEPLQALAEKYPDYISKNRATLPAEDTSRYEKQLGAIEVLLGTFHSPTYSADDAATTKKVMDLMQTMQECGAPPREIMGDLPEGMQLDPSTGMPALPEGCTIS